MLLYIYIAPILLHDQVRGQKKFRCPCDNRKAKKKEHSSKASFMSSSALALHRLVNFVAPLELATTHNDKGPACLLAFFFSGITAPRNDTKIELKRD